jgi:hypothetical protein
VTTALEIITTAFVLGGVKTPGDALRPEDSAIGLTLLNLILDGYDLDPQKAYATQVVVGNLPANTITRTIGPSANLAVAAQPTRIEVGSFFRDNGIDYPIRSVTEDEYQSVFLKTSPGLGPVVVWYNPTVPGTLSFFPVASSAVELHMVVRLPLAVFATRQTQYTLPPGYRKLLIYALTESVCTAYERQIPGHVLLESGHMGRLVDSANLRPKQLRIGIPVGYDHVSRILGDLP